MSDLVHIDTTVVCFLLIVTVSTLIKYIRMSLKLALKHKLLHNHSATQYKSILFKTTVNLADWDTHTIFVGSIVFDSERVDIYTRLISIFII